MSSDLGMLGTSVDLGHGKLRQKNIKFEFKVTVNYVARPKYKQ